MKSRAPGAPVEHPLVAKARLFATAAHRRIDHRRKYTDKPYETHLRGVAALTAEAAATPEMLAAAWLHDTVEDTPATVEDIARDFGPDVAALVEELTDVSRPGDGNRARRKALDREHLAGASAGAMTVRLADLIDNCRDIVSHDPRFGKVYLDEMESLLGVLRGGDARLHRLAQAELAKGRERLGRGRAAAACVAPAGLILASRHARSVEVLLRGFRAADIAERIGPSGRSGKIAPAQTVSSEAPLTDVIQVLVRFDACFVAGTHGVSGVVMKDDLQKPVVRMWLFGIVSMLDLEMTERIRARWPRDEWSSLLSGERAAKARALKAERERRGQSVSLLDCLQLSDKGEILMSEEAERGAFGFSSRRIAREVVSDLEFLRNNLAHCQDIVSRDWPQIVRLSRRVAEARELRI